jgi:hypothetical protein
LQASWFGPWCAAFGALLADMTASAFSTGASNAAGIGFCTGDGAISVCRDPQAHEAYLRGTFFLSQSTPDAVKKAFQPTDFVDNMRGLACPFWKSCVTWCQDVFRWPKSKHQVPGRARSADEFIKTHRGQYGVQMCRVLEVAPIGVTPTD